jgi:hypothetical protein
MQLETAVMAAPPAFVLPVGHALIRSAPELVVAKAVVNVVGVVRIRSLVA